MARILEKDELNDEWFEHPTDNIWKFERNEKTIILVCDDVTEK